tara:strand:+ start:967 stop:1968 length:1002 start_codon:yes stop_codon:yes gene_type:complete
MKEVKNEIWVLADDRPGNYSQAVGLAEELDFEHKIVNISYGSFAALPNILLGSTSKGLSREAKKSLSNLGHFPRVVIAAGRRAAPISLHIKKQSGNRTKIIQIMNPDSSHKKFDCIILPRHDRIKKSFTNVIRSIGALTKVSKSLINYEMNNYQDELSDLLKKKKIAVLVGGDGKKTKFDARSTNLLCERLVRLAESSDSQLLIITSRRTRGRVLNLISKNLEKSVVNYKIFDYNEINKNHNPYLALVGAADCFVATGDSVSMISEVCSLNKPVYIFDTAKISSKKHRRFHKSLLLEGYAKDFSEDVLSYKSKKMKILNETKRIADIIKEEFL